MAFYVLWNPKEAGSNASERMDVLIRLGQTGEEEPFLLPAEGLAQIKGMPPRLKIWIKGMCLRASRSRSQCTLHFWITVHSRYCQVDNQEQPLQMGGWVAYSLYHNYNLK